MSEEHWIECEKRIEEELGHSVFNLGGCLKIDLQGKMTFGQLLRISEICGTKKIDLMHEGASGSEFTPEGDYAEVIVWKS